MDGLLLEGVPGVAERLRVSIGEQQVVVVPDAATARKLADQIVGVEEPPAGAIVEAGGPIRLVPAEGGLLPHLTVLGNVIHGRTHAVRMTRRAALDECKQAAMRCGLGDVLKRHPHELTPGRRRVAGLVRALVAHPAVIVLEDAQGLPTWGSLLQFETNPDLWSPALLLITTDHGRAEAFVNTAGCHAD